jgi:integrase
MNITATLKNVSKKTGEGTVYIYIDLYSQNQRNRIFYKTPHKVEAKLFQNGKLIGRTDFVKKMNLRIQEEIVDIKDIIDQLKLEGKPVTKETLIEARRLTREGVKNLVTLAEEYIEMRTDAKPRQIEKLKNLVTRLKEFQGSKPIYHREVDQRFVNNFEKFLKKHQQPSTINKTFQFLRQILNYYNSIGLIGDNYKKLKYPKNFEKKQMVFLDIEIKKLLLFEPKNQRLKKVKDLSLLQLYTGLRFSDAIKLNKSNVYGGSLNISTQKTNQQISIPLHPALIKLLEEYNFDLSSLKISNVNYNKYLKELIQECGINSKTEYTTFQDGVQITVEKYKYELVGSHTFRRTFITNAIINEIPIHVIQSITGHKTLKELSKYVNIADEIKKREINKLNNLFSTDTNKDE